MFSISISDSTGSLDAILYASDAVCIFGFFFSITEFLIKETFLNGIPPSNLYENNCSMQLLEQKIQKLTVGESLIDCCLMSYFANGKRRYRVFDTILL